MKEKILTLRNDGKTYDEIVQILGCAKSTVAYHCSEKVRTNFRVYRNKNRKRNREDLKQKYGGKCHVCGYNRSLSALHFHHTDSSKKLGPVSNMFNHSKKKAYAEAKKCILLCSNCHYEYHDGIIDLQGVA